MLNCLGNFGQSLFGVFRGPKEVFELMRELWIVEFLNLLWHFQQLAKAKSVLSSQFSLCVAHVSSPAWSWTRSHSQTDSWFSLHFANQKEDARLALHNWQTGNTHTHTCMYISLYIASYTAYCLGIFFGPSGNEPHQKKREWGSDFLTNAGEIPIKESN